MNEEKEKINFYHNIYIVIALLILWNVSVWILSGKFYVSSANDLIQKEVIHAQARADDLTDSIKRNLNYLHGIPDLFSELLRVKWAVQKFGADVAPSPLSRAENANKFMQNKELMNLNYYLDFSARSLQIDMLYVINAAGDAIAASNWNTPTNTIGLNLSERNYFKQNKLGLHGMQYAVGKTTKIPGLYFATPILKDGKFYGSAVAKIDVPNLSFLINQLNAFIVDDNGVVILARNKDIEMYSLQGAAITKQSQQEKSVLYLRDNFPVLKIEPWGEKNLHSLVKVQDSTIPHLVVSKGLPEFKMTIYVDSEMKAISALSNEYFWFTLLLSALGSVLILIINGSILYFISIKNSKSQLWKQANFDSLTGLPNRDLLRDRLDQEIKKTDRSKLPLALILIDLDQFKEVNDSLGHDMGDLLLKEAANRIASCVRNSDTVARLGGDEFNVLISQLSNTAHADDIAQKIIALLAEPFYLPNEVVQISGSLGITLYPDDGSNIDDLMKHADQAMYVAKKEGRNRYSHFTQALQEGSQKRLRLIKDMRIALPNNQFKVYFQPIVKLSNGKVHKAEALLRWIHPEHGMISPVDFIPIAEETRLILDIGEWVRLESAVWCKRWNEICTESFQISVNKSPIEFMDEGDLTSVSRFIDYLKKMNLSGTNFVFEITEGMLLNLSSNVTDKLIALRDAGIQVSLDDFGTGYSSLSYLMKLDIDYLKIDRSFVCNLVPGSDDLILCEAIINMAHKLGLKVIAEGVETEQQRNLLMLANCDYAQGYLYSKPVPPEDFEIWMQKRNQS